MLIIENSNINRSLMQKLPLRSGPHRMQIVSLIQIYELVLPWSSTVEDVFEQIPSYRKDFDATSSPNSIYNCMRFQLISFSISRPIGKDFDADSSPNSKYRKMIFLNFVYDCMIFQLMSFIISRSIGKDFDANSSSKSNHHKVI